MAVCGQCGNLCPDGDLFCRVCGRAVAPSNVAGSSAPAVTSGKATASMFCGFFFFLLPSAIVAIVLGHISLSEIRRSSGRIKGDGRAITGLVLGYMGIFAVPFILIIAAIAIPNLLRARIAANESSAVAMVRNINVAEASFSGQHPDRGFTCSLSELTSAGLLQLPTDHQRSGYRFDLTSCDTETPGRNSKYAVTAEPLVRNQTGVRAFCTNQGMQIRFDAEGSASSCLDHGTDLQ